MANYLYLIKAIIEAFCYVIKWICQVFIGFFQLWDMEKWLICFVIFIVLTFVTCISKKKLWAMICSLFDFLSLLGVFVSNKR